MADLIIKNACQNNLKSLNVSIPSDAITVVVGPSGSGKSSLVFDTIYAEGQRRYIESLSSYTRQFLERIDKPNVESIENISPTVALQQKNRTRGSRANVSTLTEIYDYLRLLYAKVGTTYCPNCNIEVKKPTRDGIINDLIDNYKDQRVYILFKTRGRTEDLLLAGFVRVFVNGSIIDISEEKIELPEETYVVLDRFRIKEEDRLNIANAVEQASYAGKGQLALFLPDTGRFTNIVFDMVCISCGKHFYELDPRLFSFDSPLGACPECRGFGNKLVPDDKKLIPDPFKSLISGAVELLNRPAARHQFEKMIMFLQSRNVDVKKPYIALSAEEKSLIFTGGGKGKSSFMGINKIFYELEKKKYKVFVRVILSKYRSAVICQKCKGSRLNGDALYVKVAGKNIHEVQQLSVKDFYQWLANLKLNETEKKISNEIMRQLLLRTSFMLDVGLSYLTLLRLGKTLSNGEAQRIALANQLGSALVDTTYILDEPSIGLHARDVERLINVIKKLRDNGNRVIVVEHDPMMINTFDYIVELGPGSGIRGGELVFSGTRQDFLSKADTITSKALKQTDSKEHYSRRTVGPATEFLNLYGVTENNLKNINLKLPLNRFVCVTGVSGSGKSSLVRKALYGALLKEFDVENSFHVNYDRVEGVDKLKGMCLIDQDPVSKSPRSIPLTYIKGFDDVRSLFAETSLARSRGYTGSHFSFNMSEGQCPACKGDGFISVEMQFMADVYMKCELCRGTRYKNEILDIKYNEKNIHQVLQMTVEDAYKFFIHVPGLRNSLKLLIDTGLEYLQLGQPATTLSGGETQRIKICKELIKDAGKKRKGRILYIMDEPTTGLHYNEIKKLVIILQRLVDEGNSLVVIEHNMDLIKYADYIIDLGPEGGDSGGNVVVEGTPEQVSKHQYSHTGKFLRL